MTGTLLGARSEDHTSSGNSLALAGTVITGNVDIAESVGPAPLLRPMYAITTESGVSCASCCSFKVAMTGSLWAEHVTTVTRLSRLPSARVKTSTLSLSEPRHKIILWLGTRK